MRRVHTADQGPAADAVGPFLGRNPAVTRELRPDPRLWRKKTETTMKTHVFASFLALSAGIALAAAPASAQATRPVNPNAAQATATGKAAPDASNFTATAAMSNQFEIESSQLAESKAKSPQVKSFARQMIKDHTKAGQKLMAVASKANVQVPSSTALDSAHQQQLSALNTSSDFDRDYVQAQLQAHQEAVALFKAYGTGGDNRDLKQFASKTLPDLEKHLRNVEKLAR
jgi:putative membrane protein